jgi:hypothetical protein
MPTALVMPVMPAPTRLLWQGRHFVLVDPANPAECFRLD